MSESHGYSTKQIYSKLGNPQEFGLSRNQCQRKNATALDRASKALFVLSVANSCVFKLCLVLG